MSTLRPHVRRYAGRIALALATLVLPAALAPRVPGGAAAVTVGDPADPGALARQVQAAYRAGARRIRIRPGTYVLPQADRADFVLNGWSHAVLSAYHVTLVMTDLRHDCFALNDCTGVTLEGPTVSQNAVTFYQGRVVATGKGADGKPFLDWRPDAGYPVSTAADKTFLAGDANVVDARTRRLKRGVGDFYGVADCTVQDVTLLRNGFAPLREEGGGGNHYLHDIWKLGPRPAGATEDPLVTSAADGMHMTDAYPGPDIEGCVMTGVFLDDCIAIHGYFATVTGASGDTVNVKGGPGEMVVGQPVRISDPKGFYAQANVTALRGDGDGTTTATLDRALRVPAGAKLSNPMQNGAGYRIIGCRFGSTRSRGILAKADDGLIQDNRILGCGMSAVSLGPEYAWGEADYVHHVVVEHNVIAGNGNAGYGGAACLVHGDGAVGNRDITIRDNRFAANYQGDCDVEWVAGATIRDNVITGAAPWPPTLPPQTMMRVANATNVTLRGNVVRNAAVYQTPLVAVGAGTTGVANNDAAGVRVPNSSPRR